MKFMSPAYYYMYNRTYLCKEIEMRSPELQLDPKICTVLLIRFIENKKWINIEIFDRNIYFSSTSDKFDTPLNFLVYNGHTFMWDVPPMYIPWLPITYNNKLY